MRLPGLLRLSRGSLAGAIDQQIATLPAYQVALWPDGWECSGDGSVLIRDTDAMAEARRWYALAERNRCRIQLDRAMRLHGAFVPRPILSLSTRRFVSGRVASVAVELVAGDWVRQRRQQLIVDAAQALRERALSWSGSRSGECLDADALEQRVCGLIAQCVVERLIPRVMHRVRVQREDGFGLTGFRCIVEVNLDPYARSRLADALGLALVPWNRAVVRDGRPHTLIAVETRPLVKGCPGSLPLNGSVDG